MTFNIFDLNKNGKIEKQEIEKIIESFYEMTNGLIQHGNVREKVKEIMRKFDKNHDNMLSYEEFVDGCSKDDNLRNIFYAFENK